MDVDGVDDARESLHKARLCVVVVLRRDTTGRVWRNRLHHQEAGAASSTGCVVVAHPIAVDAVVRIGLRVGSKRDAILDVLAANLEGGEQVLHEGILVGSHSDHHLTSPQLEALLVTHA